jgi:hypothetical protein
MGILILRHRGRKLFWVDGTREIIDEAFAIMKGIGAVNDEATLRDFVEEQMLDILSGKFPKTERLVFVVYRLLIEPVIGQPGRIAEHLPVSDFVVDILPDAGGYRLDVIMA